jgi:hypothetical protein
MSVTPPKIKSDVLDADIKYSCILRVPANAVEAYKQAKVWRSFKNIVAVEDMKANRLI